MGDESRRRLNKVTFTSIQPGPEDIRSGAVEKRMRGLDKIAYASALRTNPSELKSVVGTVDDDLAREGLAALSAALTLDPRPRSRAGWKVLAKTSVPALAAAGRALARYRRDARGRLATFARTLVADHLAHLRKEAETSAGIQRRPRPTIVLATPATSASASAPPTDGVVAPSGPYADNPWKTEPTDDPRLAAASLRSNVGAAIDWARVTAPERANELATAVHRVVGIDVAAVPGLSVADWDKVSDTVVTTGEDTEDWTDDLVDGFEERMRVEPVGRVHLERLDMTPVAVSRGELLHSVGLAPKETITVIHREWSSRETSFEKVVSDEYEQSTEEGVTENTELASATETQARHASELSTEASASGSYAFASASMTVGYTSTSEDETAKQESRNHAVSVTRKASARTRKEHKTTFTVKETAGVEDQVVRTLTNPSETAAMRVDFHQLLRKWKVDLYRYGLRLTFDLVVPAPGIDLLANIDEVRRIDHLLAQPFSFALMPVSITRASYLQLAAKYGAEVPPPPPENVMIHHQLFFGAVDSDTANVMRFEAFEFETPEGFRIKRGEFFCYCTLDQGGFFEVPGDSRGPVSRPDGGTNYLFTYESGVESLEGRSGKLAVVMALFRVRSGYARATLEAVPSLDTWREWQQTAWTAMRRAAEEKWAGERQELARRREQLGEAIGTWDPLSLRKMEREEVMKTTLKWIFGPAFDLMPGEMARLYSEDDGSVASIEPSRLTPAQWAQVMGIGEFVKFMQQAIEWENVLYMVYPYFWDHPRNHKLKRFLNHPDSIHRAFLRGGAARVVLTIRPGFEESFTRLYETGTLDEELESDHPYLTIAQEIRAYAATHYPGIPPGGDDPDAVEAAERGVKIGQWNEYTPVSALDISINTPLEDLI
jgi:hypothetical protein